MAQANESGASTTEGNDQSKSILPHWAQALTSQAADIGTKYVTYQQFTSKVAIVDNAHGILSTPFVDNGQRIVNFTEYQKLNATTLPNECLVKPCGVPIDKMVNVTAKMNPEAAENFRQNMLEGLGDLKAQMANDYIYASAAVSAGLIVLQMCKLMNVWNEIKNAENLHKDPMKFAAIEQKFEEFKKVCIWLEDLITNQQVDDIVLETMELNEKYTETILLINKLEVKINGMMQRLELAGIGQCYDAFSNFLMVTNNIVQLVALFESATNPAKAIAGTIIAAFSFLLIANVTTYSITQKRLTELRTDIQKLQQLELEVQKHNTNIKKVLRDHRRRRT